MKISEVEALTEKAVKKIATEHFDCKEHYIRNYLPQAYDHISMFCCGMTDEEEKSRKYKISRWYKYYSSVAFGYFKDKDFVETENQYMAHLRDSYDQIKNDSDVFRKMIKYELYNHECGYTGEYNEALSAVGLEYSDLTENQKAILKEEFKKCCENTI